MRCASLLVAVTLVIGFGLSITHRLPSALAADDVVTSDADKTYPVTYRLTDLPIWYGDGKACNPTVLVAYLKASVDSDTWSPQSEMSPYKSYFVVTATSANHDRIKKILDDLRTAARAPAAE